MTQAHDLTGLRILVVEDDFYLADDEREALETAGAQVLGPCASVATALALLGDDTPDAAILDISLTDGPSFELARKIASRGIPTLFVTGYDASAIPADLRGIVRLQKPVTIHRFMAAVVRLLEADDGEGRP